MSVSEVFDQNVSQKCINPIETAFKKVGIDLPSVSENVEITRGDIWIVDLCEYDFNTSVQQKQRPMLIIQNNVGNKNAPTVICASITSKNKKQYPMHMPINLSVPSMILFEQIFTVDKGRLIKKIGQLTPEELFEAERKLGVSIGQNHLSVLDIDKVTVYKKVITVTRDFETHQAQVKVILKSSPNLNMLVDLGDDYMENFLNKNDSLDELETKVNTIKGLKIVLENLYSKES